MPQPRRRPPQTPKEMPNLDPLGPDDAQAASIGETPDEEFVSEMPDEYEAVMVQSPGVTERKQGPTPPPEKLKLVENPDRTSKPEAKSGPPTLDEWQDFIGRFAIRGITEAYLSFALSDIEDELSPREREQIRLTQEDLKEMAAPMASLAHKSKFARRKGRGIIAAADSMESVIAMVIWMRRVNKIAKKYRKPKNTTPVQGFVVEGPENGNSGSNGEQGPGTGSGWGVFNPGSGG